MTWAECFAIESKYYKVDGVLGLHVDDYIGGGEGVNNKTDFDGDYKTVTS